MKTFPILNRTQRLAWALLVMLVAAGILGNTADAASKPNIVIIFADDLGYADIGVFGAKGFSTPNLDRLASQGTVFRNFHVAQPVCSASRAALLTGCYPNRVGIHGALGPRSQIGIHENETTIAELVKQRGYQTAIFGKWHLGDSPKFLPTRHGFDEYFGLPYSNDMWPFHPDLVNLPPDSERRKRGYPDLPLLDGEKVVNPRITPEDQNQLTTWYTERAVRFIEQNQKRPFLLYLAHSMPHVPLGVSDKFRGKTSRGLYGDVIAEIDWSVGEVLQALNRAKIEKNTLVIFTSDNGPWLSYGDHSGSALPLREGKGTSWEGGTRVPCIMRWPGKIPADRENQSMVMTIDLLPTIAGLVRAPLPNHPIDGQDVWPILAGKPRARNPHSAYWFYYAQNQLQAVSSADGRWKLVLPHAYRTLAGKPGGTNGFPASYSQSQVGDLELYDLQLDITETVNVADKQPKVVSQLLQQVEQARLQLGDTLTKRLGGYAREPGRLK